MPPVANFRRKLSQTPLPQDTEGQVIELQLACQPTSYTLEIKVGAVEQSYEVSASDLTTLPPVGGAFAGVMYGVYSFGKGEPVLDPADFTDIMVTG